MSEGTASSIVNPSGTVSVATSLDPGSFLAQAEKIVIVPINNSKMPIGRRLFNAIKELMIYDRMVNVKQIKGSGSGWG